MTMKATEMSLDAAREAMRIFERAIELPRDDHEAFLRVECRNDETLLRKVQALISATEESDDLLPKESAASVGSVVHARSSIAIGCSLAGRYELVATIGRGGMGDVYRARDLQLGREVAIKTLKQSNFSNQEMAQRFDREMRSVAALSHPNIVTLHDVAEHDGVKFAVMELVSGSVLTNLISDGIQWDTSARLARDVALALSTAHSRNMMHRDIKPDNIVVDANSRAKVLDFGLARLELAEAEQDITMGRLVPGTIPYMSPEQAQSEELTCATDIFSLGTVIYEMLSGANPFRAAGPLETMQNIASTTPTNVDFSFPGLPRRLCELVTLMHSPAPGDRPKAIEVVETLDAVLGNPIDRTSADGLASTSREAVEPKRIPLSRKRRWQPSLIVLPFQVFGKESQLDAVADGLVENLTTILTRVPMLSITSRMSSFSLKGQSVTASEVRRKFAVDYMIEGSVQQFGAAIRANVQLIETEQGFHAWAQQFDCRDADAPITDLLHQILARLESQLVRAILNDLRDESDELNGRQLLLQAMGLLSLKGWHRDSFEQATQMLRQSVELEPDLALSHAYLALIRGLGKRVGLVSDPDTAEREAIKHAEMALELDESDSNVLGLAGCAFTDIGQISRGTPILKNAITINPNNAQAHAALGTAALSSNETQDAIIHIKKGIEISPLDGRLAVWYATLAIAYVQAEELDKALEAALAGCQADRKTYLPRVALTAVYIARDETAEAIAAWRESLRVKPDLTNDEVNCLVGRKLGIGIRRLQKLQ